MLTGTRAVRRRRRDRHARRGVARRARLDRAAARDAAGRSARCSGAASRRIRATALRDIGDARCSCIERAAGIGRNARHGGRAAVIALRHRWIAAAAVVACRHRCLAGGSSAAALPRYRASRASSSRSHAVKIRRMIRTHCRVSPDGTPIVYVSDGGLSVRPARSAGSTLDSMAPPRVPGHHPDSRSSRPTGSGSAS